MDLLVISFSFIVVKKNKASKVTQIHSGRYNTEHKREHDNITTVESSHCLPTDGKLDHHTHHAMAVEGTEERLLNLELTFSQS